MRHGRAKKARKTLSHFERTIGLKPPYSVLLDGNFIVAMTRSKLPIDQRVSRVLHADADTDHSQSSAARFRRTPTVRFCVLDTTRSEVGRLLTDLQQQKHEKAQIFQQALAWIDDNCIVEPALPVRSESERNNTQRHKHSGDRPTQQTDSHTDGGSTPENRNRPKRKRPKGSIARQSDTYRHIIHCANIKASNTHAHPNNNNTAKHDINSSSSHYPYIVATQDEDLLSALRNLGTVPIIRLANHTVVVMENPSRSSQNNARREEVDKWTKGSLQSVEQELVTVVGRPQSNPTNVAFHAEAKLVHRERRKRKAKGPNPLSCKKPKKTDHGVKRNTNNTAASGQPNKKKRRRKKKSSALTDNSTGTAAATATTNASS